MKIILNPIWLAGILSASGLKEILRTWRLIIELDGLTF
jgi:hypothetical protein